MNFQTHSPKIREKRIELNFDFLKTIFEGREKSAKRRFVEKLLNILRENPFQNPPPYEKLVGDLQGVYSRRINIQHRLVYQANKEQQIVRLLRMWTHYE